MKSECATFNIPLRLILIIYKGQSLQLTKNVISNFTNRYSINITNLVDPTTKFVIFISRKFLLFNALLYTPCSNFLPKVFMKEILTIKDLYKIYHSGTIPITALDGISFSIMEGEIFGLLGVNGAGKTTLSSILATLHPPTSGKVLFRGKSIYDELMTYRSKLGFCPQRPNLDPFLNVRDNLVFAGRYHVMPERKIQTRVDELLENLELTRYASFDIDTLSGGTKQRLLIARSLVHTPDIVILDEPTVGLDADIRQKLWKQIKQLKKMGITIILTTHYLDEAELLSDRICILNKGKIIRIESVSKLKREHNMASLEDIFLQLTREADQEIAA